MVAAKKKPDSRMRPRGSLEMTTSISSDRKRLDGKHVSEACGLPVVVFCPAQQTPYPHRARVGARRTQTGARHMCAFGKHWLDVVLSLGQLDDILEPRSGVDLAKRELACG